MPKFTTADCGISDSERAARKNIFGKPEAGAKDSWDKWGDRAEHERAVMVSEFNTWVLKTRAALERKLFTSERHMLSISPFARAGLDEADTPADVPIVVIEFANESLNVLEHSRKLRLINTYYPYAAGPVNDVSFSIDPGDESEVHELWHWFMDDRDNGVTA